MRPNDLLEESKRWNNDFYFGPYPLRWFLIKIKLCFTFGLNRKTDYKFSVIWIPNLFERIKRNMLISIKLYYLFHFYFDYKRVSHHWIKTFLSLKSLNALLNHKHLEQKIPCLIDRHHLIDRNKTIENMSVSDQVMTEIRLLNFVFEKKNTFNTICRMWENC